MKKLLASTIVLFVFACQENLDIEPLEVVETEVINEELEKVVEFDCVFVIEETVCEQALLEEIERAIETDLEELVKEQPVIREVAEQ